MIDLRKDAALFGEALRRCAMRYSMAHQSSVGLPFHPPITRIDFVFSLGDGSSTPWVYLHLDTKTGSKPDGDPTHPMFEWIEHPEWGAAFRFLVEFEGNQMPVILPNGKLCECDAGKFQQIVGDLLVQSLKATRDQGGLSEFPLARGCEMGVEQAEGEYSWPPYKERGMENLAEAGASAGRKKKKHAVKKRAARKGASKKS